MVSPELRPERDEELLRNKPSRYNFDFRLTESSNAFLLYNSRTNALLRASGDISNLIHEFMNGTGQLTEEIQKELKKGGFLVDETLDELMALKVMDRRGRFNTSRYSITIAPTMACNFRCPYCYQKRTGHTMTPEVVLHVKNYIKYILSDLKPSHLHVCWYGGEVLLAKGLLLELQKDFSRRCNEENVGYDSSIVTNGYLLDVDTAQQLSKTGNTYIQITIDGTKELHDKRRVLANGEPTFDRIYQNIKATAKYFKKFQLRVNVDRRNLDAFRAVVEMLDKDGLIPMVQPYPGHVNALTDACKEYSAHCLSQEEFSQYDVETAMSLLKQCKDYAEYPGIGIGCGAVCDNSIAIDPQGFLYKCWNEVGNSEMAVGYLGARGAEFNNNIFKWIGYDLFEREECRNCSLLPLCLAGCPYEVIAKGDLEKRCIWYKNTLKEIIKLAYVKTMRNIVDGDSN
jgi:uncharacterized protein